MGAGQRKTIVVLLDLLHVHLPARYRMALFAIGAQLAAVNVGMTVLAALSHIGKYRLGMALDARHRLMHAAQRITSLIVIELRNRANRLPPVRGMAVLTGDVQIPVRTMGTCRRLRSRAWRDEKR